MAGSSRYQHVTLTLYGVESRQSTLPFILFPRYSVLDITFQ